MPASTAAAASWLATYGIDVGPRRIRCMEVVAR